jgi:hypothetical protein
MTNQPNVNYCSELQVEYFAGDCMKVIGVICHQLCDFDAFQNQEILAVVRRDFLKKPLPPVDIRKSRPKPSRKFLKTYHSGNELTLSKPVKEKNAGARFAVIRAMSEQLSVYDNLNEDQIYALIQSYLEIHIIEVDV